MTASDRSPEELIDRYLLGLASAEEIAVLNEQLAHDESLRQHYRRSIALEGGYREAAIHFAEPAEDADFPAITQPAITPATSSSRPPQHSILWSKNVTVVLLVVAVAMTGKWLLQDFIAPLASVDDQAVARLVTSVDAAWRGTAPEPGSWITPGRFHLESGTIKLEFSRGARLTVQGPADFQVLHADLLHVSVGNLVARIPEEAIGFTITTDETEVVDLGTEFGLRVGQGRQTEVHVMEGLVEVFERDTSDQRSAGSVRVKQGQAVRWSAGEAQRLGSESIPVRSSEAVLGTGAHSPGLTILQGSIRLKQDVSKDALKRQATSWIEVIPEQSGVLLEQALPVTLTSPGHYRMFPASEAVVPVGTRVDSYLLHFRSTQPAPIQGVIKFDRQIVGLICEADQLAVSDPVVGRSGVRYPVGSRQYRGLEPRGAGENLNSQQGGGWTPDDVTISQDMRTLGLGVNVNPLLGVDQLRVLVRSEEGS
ncbi:MAG: hypothetical protein NXI04_15805 [Planctomycetaceae bacterium]|nr:hypothetical protein [Planctomycetaceae bacterium]